MDNVDLKNEKKVDDSDLWKMFKNVDPDTGLDLDWLEVRDYLCEHGAAKGLEKVFDYYQMKNPRMEAYVNYLLACSHFTEEELEGTPINRAYRRRLETKVKKLLKKRESDKHTPIHQFLHDNKNIQV